MKVAMYARVSTQDKDQTPETQLHGLRQYAESRGWEVTGEYIDFASAADQRGRKEWRRLLQEAQSSRGFDAIAVTKLDRAFRSVKETHNTLDMLDHHNVAFISTTQPIDTSTSMGKFTLTVLAAFAEFERDMIAERVKEGMARAKDGGKHLGRPKGSKDKGQRKRAGYFK